MGSSYATEMIDGRSMNPEIAHLDHETRTQGALGHTDQLGCYKDPTLHYEWERVNVGETMAGSRKNDKWDCNSLL